MHMEEFLVDLNVQRLCLFAMMGSMVKRYEIQECGAWQHMMTKGNEAIPIPAL